MFPCLPLLGQCCFAYQLLTPVPSLQSCWQNCGLSGWIEKWLKAFFIVTLNPALLTGKTKEEGCRGEVWWASLAAENKRLCGISWSRCCHSGKAWRGADLYVVTSERSLLGNAPDKYYQSCCFLVFYPASNTWEQVTEGANCGSVILLYSLDPLCAQINVEL